MKVLVAMNAFKGALSSIRATRTLASGLQAGFPEAEVTQRPLADGGDGTLEVMASALGTRAVTEYTEVSGPLGERVKAPVLFVPDEKLAVVESALACGIALLPPGVRDPSRASSYGVGELIRYAIERGSRTVLVGVGGTATNDGGIGMARALGAQILDSKDKAVPPGTRGLFKVSRVLPGEIPDLCRGIRVLVACDVSNPLTGPEGATATYGPQKGVRPEEIAGIDAAMERYGTILERDLGVTILGIPRAGAGGGLAAGLKAFLGGELLDGARFIMEQAGVVEALRTADVVITGEGRMDSQTRKGKAPQALASEARTRGKAVIAVAGSLNLDFLESLPDGFSAAFSTCPGPVSLDEAIQNAEKWLFFTGQQLGTVLRVGAVSRMTALEARHPGTPEERSYGGIVVRKASNSALEVLLIKDRFGVYAPPKGHLEPGEEPAEGAVREVLEETGVLGKVMAEIGDTTYAYLDPLGVPTKKSVTYFLMTPVSEAGPTPQLGETLDAAWVPEDRLVNLPSYPNNAEVIQKALDMYRRLAPFALGTESP
ncbi:MAG TPA: glycerate kinase [Firmicutes bacterium]|nr:glycerate kinase [Candidatus Fermentithermobacillaceae bacterium]